jgi:hypothetical protein
MLRYALMLFSCFIISGCAASMVANEVFDGHHTNLKQNSYAAADMLAQQSRETIRRDSPIKIGTLLDVHNNKKADTSFGKLIPSQVGARFVQLGYNIMTASPMSMNYTQAQMKDMQLSHDSSNNNDHIYAVITGSYALGKKDVYVSLQLVEYQSGKILAAYDYSLPLSSDIKKLAKRDSERDSTSQIADFW